MAASSCKEWAAQPEPRGPWPSNVTLGEIATEMIGPSFQPVPPREFIALLQRVREQTARACLALVTDEGAKDRIRMAFGIPGPYQWCGRCGVYCDNHSECRCGVQER